MEVWIFFIYRKEIFDELETVRQYRRVLFDSVNRIRLTLNMRQGPVRWWTCFSFETIVILLYRLHYCRVGYYTRGVGYSERTRPEMDEEVEV